MPDPLILKGSTHILRLQHCLGKVAYIMGVSCRPPVEVHWLYCTTTNQQKRDAQKENLVHFN